MKPTQKNRPIQIATPLGDDVLLFYSMSGRENLSEPFAYRLQLLSENALLNPESLLGENVTISLEMPDLSHRFFNGYITEFGQYDSLNGFAYYQAVIRPWLWFLTKTANCRIFQEKTVPELILEIFRGYGFSDIKDRLQETYLPREYCVQYRESDFNFVSRLMEQAGIYYYFEHENGRHYLVLADSGNAHSAFPNYQTIPYHADQQATDKSRTDHIDNWSFSRQIQTGAYSLNDYDFKKPNADLLVKSVVPQAYPHSGYEIFDYPGFYQQAETGDQYVRHRLEEQHIPVAQYSGAGNARGLAAGYTFTLSDYPRRDQNRAYLIIAADYRLQNAGYLPDSHAADDRLFECSFIAIAATQPYRPPRITPKPVIAAAQTAIVVGPKGEEIYTDQFGRVKAQFHWDRYGQHNEHSSCWIRVSSPWAGKNWGMLALPRIGQEVLVSFLEADPDQPIITGTVYNAAVMPPYKLPDNAHLSTIKTQSTKGGGGFNELRFNDRKGKEQVFIHAERNYDLRVKHNAYQWLGNEQHTIIKKDQLLEVQGDSHATVKGDLNQSIKGTLSLKVAGDQQVKTGAKYALDAGQEIHIKAGTHIVIEAGASITLKAGGGFITIGPDNVIISGSPELLDSGGTPGSGSGCTPDPAKLPDAADDAKPGHKPAAKTAVRPPKPESYGPSATVLKLAAQNGTAFCEKCADAFDKNVG